MLSYNHFQQNKLKYVILGIFFILILVLIRCYCNNKDKFTNKEGFSNGMVVDVLLGKKFDKPELNRVSLSDNIKESGENELNILYSTYYIQPSKDNTQLSKDVINIFLRTNVSENSKIIGDLCLKINSKKLSFDDNNEIIFNNENVPHLLNPILKKENALELTEKDIKKKKDINGIEEFDIIEKQFDYNEDKDYTQIFLNLLGINNKNDSYKNNNMKKIYNFFTEGKTDEDLLGKNNSQVLNDLDYKRKDDSDAFNIINTVTYIEELQIYFNDIENNTLNIKSQIAMILYKRLEDIRRVENKPFTKRIYAGYKIGSNNITFPFTMEEGGKTVTIDNNNKFKFKNNVLKKLKYENKDSAQIINSLIDFYNIEIDTIILFEGTVLETKFEIPYLETGDDYIGLDDVKKTQVISYNNGGTNTNVNINYNDVNNSDDDIVIDLDAGDLDINENININNSSLKINLEKNLDFSEVKDKIENFKNSLDYILNNPNFFLKIPLNFIRMNDPLDDDTHIIFGDILDTGDIINTENNILSNYVKVPRRCCFKTEQFYGDDNNKPIMPSMKGIDGNTYNIYQHPIYKTFKVFAVGENLTNKHIYEIEPCAPNVSLYENNIKAYNKLKGKCKNIKTFSDDNKIKDNSFNQLQIRTKLNTINKNKQNLDSLRNEVKKLEGELDRKEIIKSNYNRSKLQKYNEHKQDQIYEGRRRLNKKNGLGLTVTYPQEVLKYLIQFYGKRPLDGLTINEQEKNNKMYDKLLQFDNQTSNKDFNKFIEQQIKEDNIDIVKLLPDPNSQKFKDKWINRKLLESKLVERNMETDLEIGE